MERVGPRRLEAMGTKILALQDRTRFLEGELVATRATLQQARGRITNLEQQLVEEKSHAATLVARISEMQHSEASPSTPATPEAPAPQIPFKANVSKDNKRPPGRPPGHAAAHRPLPRKIDTHVTAPVPRDRLGVASCPACHCQLQHVKKHRRIVEDIVPARRIVTCYHTTSGYCPGCRKQMESREKNQPPAPAGVKLPQSQLGLNSLATAALLRIRYRLPFRQIQQLFLDLPGLSIGASGVARQMQRMARWLAGQYDRLKVLIRAGPVVHMDETGWRIDGQNHWLWTMLSGKATLFHIDKSRGQKVPAALLGEHFGGTLVSDFYGAYGKLKCPKQKCLAHLLRELKNTREKHPAFASGNFALRLRRLLAQMLLLKPKKRALGRVAYQSRVRKLERRLLELERGPEGGGGGGGIKWKEPQARRLALRLRRHHGELTAFLTSKDVEPTNNAAERALRPAVVMRKISGGSRSQAGAKATAVLMTILRTAMQQGCPLFETIKALLTAHWAGENPALLTDTFKNSA